MTLAVVAAEGASDIRLQLDELQLQQFKHDETYHREIARLSVQDRLRHMALHFAKYSGRFVEAEAAGDEALKQRIATDVFIIGVSTANILNIRLVRELEALGRPRAATEFASSLAIGAGKMAAACEKLDHLEDFPFRVVIRDAALRLVDAAIEFADGRGWNLRQLVQERLGTIKENFIHHGHV